MFVALVRRACPSGFGHHVFSLASLPNKALRIAFQAVQVCLLVNLMGVSASEAQHSEADREPFTLAADTWPQADALFRRNPRWLGGDDAYSVDLGNRRILWLFADSFIATSPANVRREAKLIRNSVAIQHGYDPSLADIKFYWRKSEGKPESFFPESGNIWYWPGHGTRVQNKLLIFLMKVRQADTDLGFEVFGWTAVIISNPDHEPSQWKMSWLNTPANDFEVIIGSASILRINKYIYAYGAEEPGVHDVYVVRWPVHKVVHGDLKDPEWWTGNAGGWVQQSVLTRKPPAVFSNGQTEFTVHYDKSLDQFLQIQTKGFGPAELGWRWSKTLTGPWSELRTFYKPQEASRADALIYAGKAHPRLVGADLVLTYVVNSINFSELISDTSIYYPRFLRATVKRD